MADLGAGWGWLAAQALAAACPTALAAPGAPLRTNRPPRSPARVSAECSNSGSETVTASTPAPTTEPAALAVPRWRLVLGWALADALVWPLLMWHMLGIDNKGIPHELLDMAILVRDGFIIAMAVIVLRQMWNNTEDKVRAAHTGRDPVAGVFQ